MGFINDMGLKEFRTQEAKIVSDFSSVANRVDDQEVMDTSIGSKKLQAKNGNMFIKKPHTLGYKFESYRFQTGQTGFDAGEELKNWSRLDNLNATTSELLAEKRNRGLGFECARYLPRMIHGYFYVISPETLHEYDFASYMDASVEKSFNQSGDTTFIDRLLGAIRGDVMPNYRGSIKDFLKVKHKCLEIMTSQCFDELIASKILTIFDFSDDEHGANIILFKEKGKQKYEHVYLLDKESNTFAFNLAKGENLESVKYILKTFVVRDDFVDSSVCRKEESFFQKIVGLTKLLKKGELDSKFFSLIQEIGKIPYEDYAQDLKKEFGINVNRDLLDCYHVGQEGAERICARLG